MSTISIVGTATVPVASLSPYPRNPRNGDIEAVTESIRAHGVYRHLVVNRRDNVVLAGNHLLHAAHEAGLTEVPVSYVDVDDEEAARIVLVDNRASQLGGFDEGLLANLLESLPDLSGTGYSEDALDELLARVNEAAGTGLVGDPDEVPEPPAEPITKRGDLITLGRHRLLCGDATVLSDVERLMGGEQADMVWTDPPYGVAYVGKTKDALTIENDRLDEGALRALLTDAFSATWTVCRAGAAWYVAAPAGPLHLLFGSVLQEQGILRQTLIWVKNSLVLGHGDYHYRHETLCYGWKPGAAHHAVPDRSQDSVWEIDRPTASREHPTMKPVELVARALRNSSKPGAVVLDLFGGSGTTLIAAEQEGRQARLLEIDPRYCDVIVARYEQATGGKVERHAQTNEAHA